MALSQKNEIRFFHEYFRGDLYAVCVGDSACMEIIEKNPAVFIIKKKQSSLFVSAGRKESHPGDTFGKGGERADSAFMGRNTKGVSVFFYIFKIKRKK